MTEEPMAHPPAETIAAFAEGKLERRRIPEVLAHLQHCETCMTAIELANDEIGAAGPRSRMPWLLAVAAAIAAVAIASLLFVRMSRSPVDRLVAAAPRGARVVEPRLAGGFPWAAYRGPLRADGTAPDPARLRLSGAAADAVERGNADASPAAQHAAGLALVLIDDPKTAIAHLRAATARAPNDAAGWSDLAAAEYAAAARGEASLLPDALGHAEHALRLDPRLPEALFNRALILEHLGVTDEARAAWTRYLETDPSSPWADEARQHLAQLPAAHDGQLFDADRPRLEAAAVAGDAATVAQIVVRHRERARTFGEAEYLPRWAEAAQSGRAADAARWLAVARAIGDALVQLSGESLLHDAVATNRGELAGALLAYRRGGLAFSKGKPGEAQPDLRTAAAQFAAAGDPMSFAARFYAANTRYALQDVAGARAELEALLADLRAHPHYVAARANALWELSLCRMAEGDWSGAVASLRESAAGFERLGESSNLAAVENLRAGALDVLGHPDEAWRARIRALALESRERRGDRLAVGLSTASAALVRAEKPDAARALLAIEERTRRAAGGEGPLVYTLTREAQLAAATGDDDAALAAAKEALAVAARMADPVLRARETAAARLAEGAAELRRAPAHARALLTEALEGFTKAALQPRIADAALLRARAELALGDAAAASRDLDAGLAALDRMRIPLGGGAAPGVYDTGAALFEEAVRLHLDRGDAAGAFAYAERSRAQLGAAIVNVAELQRRLAGSGTAVIESFVAGGDVVTFAIDERDFVAARRPLPGASDAALYDALLRPAESLVARARRLVVVPDRRFSGVAYAALTDGTRALVDRLPVAVAPSASALAHAPRPALRSAVAMVLTSSAAAALPDSAGEVAEVARLYPAGSVVPASLAALRGARADVLHIAGHTARDGDDDAALLFGDDRASWNAVAATPLHADVVTLSACETLRDPAQRGGRALSLGAGFLAAGAHDVVGTLVPITDRDARTLFRHVHEQLAAGIEPSEAVRRAQIADRSAGGKAWRAVAVVTNRLD
jgi:hypothetical protein